MVQTGRDVGPQILRSPDGQVRCGAPGRPFARERLGESLIFSACAGRGFGFGAVRTMGDARLEQPFFIDLEYGKGVRGGK